MEHRATPGPAAAAPFRVTWGLPDVAVAFVAGLVVATVAVAPWITGGEVLRRDEVAAGLASLFAQNLALVLVLVLVSRFKGTGRLSRDFGLRVRLRDGGFLLVGMLLQLGAGALLLPITELADRRQEVARVFERARGTESLLFVVGVLVVAPLGEELLYRGALLRGLVRRTSAPMAIVLSALVFALVHLIGGLGSGPVLPGLLLLGLVSGAIALRRGDLSRSILLHAGFNLTAAIWIVA